MVLSWKEKDADSKLSTKKTNAKPASAPRKKGKEPDPQPISHYLNLYEDIEDADDPSESEALKDAVDNTDVPEPTTSRISQAGAARSAGSTDRLAALEESTTSRIPQAGASRSAGSTDRSAAMQSTPAAVPEDDPAARLQRLKEARRLVSV